MRPALIWCPDSAVFHAFGQTYISEMQFDPTRDSHVVPTTNRAAVLTVLPSIMLPMFLAVVDQTIVATALPVIGASTGNVQRVSWIVVGYLIASTIAAPVYGRLGDAFGRRRRASGPGPPVSAPVRPAASCR